MILTWRCARLALVCGSIWSIACGARQAGTGRAARPIAECTPHVLGTIGSTLVVKTVCEIDVGAVARRATTTPWTGPRADLGVRGRSGFARAGGDYRFLAGFPMRAGPDGEPMPEPDETGPGSAEQTADRVADLLTRQDPTAAWGVLDALPMPALLEALNVLDQRGVLAVLVGVPNASPRIYAALAVRELAKVDARRLDGNALAQLSRAGEALDRLRPWDRAAAYDYVLTQRGVAPELGHTLAGLIGLEGESVRANEPVIADEPTASSAVGPPIRPLPYTPGRQPRWLYLGNQAHKAIAAYYQAVNFQDRVLSNSVPISTILAAFGRLGHAPTPSALRAWELRSRPDIVNLTQLHIYEIKPAHSHLLASRIVRIYMARFGRAGIALGLGPPEAPGTRGVVPGPGGWYVFWSPEPGVIVYQYRTGPMAPVPDADRVPVPLGGRAPSRQPAPEREGLRFELEPPGPEVVPVVVGAGLLMLMAALAVATSG